MPNPAIEWIKEHPAITASVAGGVGLIVYFMTRGGSTGSTSDAATVANAQLQQASLANQNAAVQAQAQVQEQTAAYAAQAQNNQYAAQLASVVAQTNAAQNVSINQTNAQESVANNTINAELTAQQSQVAAESQGLQTEFSYLTQVNNNQTSLQQTEIAQVPTLAAQFQHLGTGENYNNEIISLFGAATNQPSIATAGIISSGNEASNAAVSSAAEWASIGNSISSGISSAFTGLFG